MKNKINYKWVNILCICMVIYLLFLMRNVWLGVLSKIFAILLPFIIAFGVSYVLYPFLKFLMSKKIPKGVSVFIIVIAVTLMLFLSI